MTLKGADVLVAELARHGVQWVATLCGNGMNPFYLACRRSGIRLIDTHNEQAAAYIADAYARLTGQLGVCAVSSGVAHDNALTGVANAYFDGAAVLLITGASAGYGARHGVFQEFDQVALAAPICKFSSLVTRANDLPFLTRQAIAAASTGRPGPAHLTVPLDVLEGEVGELAGEPARMLPPARAAGRPGQELLRQAAKLIAHSQQPLLIAGTGAFQAQAQEGVRELSEIADMPIVTPIWDRGIVEGPHPNFLGVVGAASGEPRILADADLVVLVGAQVDYRIGFLRPPAVHKDLRVIRIDSDPGQLRQGIEPDVALVADPPLCLKEMAEEIKRLGAAHSHVAWLQEARRRWSLFRERWLKGPLPERPMTGRHIVEAICPFLTDDTIFLIDGGNIGQWAHMVLADHYPSRWLTCGASGVVGWGIPGAMAAKLAFPQRHVLLLSGDGAFGFTTAEIESAARQNLPFVAVVADDSAWGIVVSGQRQAFGEGGVLASRFGAIRYADVAKAFGAEGRVAESPEELAAAMRQGFMSERPTIIHVPIQVGGPADRAT
jgi:acetolactate synthase-1/2/3 large subunit